MENPDNSKFHIFLLDDEETTHRLVALALRKQLGCRVTVIENARQIYKLIQSDPPDLLLVDFYIDEENGIEICRSLKKTDAVRHVPVVFFSDDGDALSRATAIRAGAVEFIRKPVFPRELVTRISAHIKMHDAQKRNLGQIREQQALLRVLCHDLRNPVSAVESTLDIIGADSEESREFLSLAKEANHSALELIDHVQNHRQLVETESSYEREWLVLNELVEHSVAIISHMAKKKQIKIICEVEEQSPILINRIVFLHNILNNLLTNAIKFSHGNSQVLISGGIESVGDARFTRVCVEDQGVGMPPEMLEDILNSDGGHSRPGTEREQGHGLGLSLVKYYVEESRGNIRIESSPETESESPHSGTKITMKFPHS